MTTRSGVQQPTGRYTRIVNRILGHTKVSANIPATKYGNRMEDVGAQHYTERMKKNHRKPVTICWLFFSKGRPYLSASPDRLVSCDCCEPGLMEKKWSFAVPQEHHPSNTSVFRRYRRVYLTKLKKHNRIYFQVQGQMVADGVIPSSSIIMVII